MLLVSNGAELFILVPHLDEQMRQVFVVVDRGLKLTDPVPSTIGGSGLWSQETACTVHLFIYLAVLGVELRPSSMLASPLP